jgi:hypothetical protein
MQLREVWQLRHARKSLSGPEAAFLAVVFETLNACKCVGPEPATRAGHTLTRPWDEA